MQFTYTPNGLALRAKERRTTQAILVDALRAYLEHGGA
jgi:hypothetical protein